MCAVSVKKDVFEHVLICAYVKCNGLPISILWIFTFLGGGGGGGQCPKGPVHIENHGRIFCGSWQNYSRSEQIMADHGGLRQITADYGRLWQITADYGRSRQIIADQGGLQQITADYGGSW